MSFKFGNSEFWGTQYHPEFDFNIMSKIIIARKSLLISENVFQNENHANEIISYSGQAVELQNLVYTLN